MCNCRKKVCQSKPIVNGNVICCHSNTSCGIISRNEIKNQKILNFPWLEVTKAKVQYRFHLLHFKIGELWCLTPLSTIFKLYCGGAFQNKQKHSLYSIYRKIYSILKHLYLLINSNAIIYITSTKNINALLYC